jgi:hypothetical protein
VPLSQGPNEQRQRLQEKGRPPSIIVTSAADLIQLKKQLKGVAKQSFEFRNTKNGNTVVTKYMVDYKAVK